MPTDLTPTLKDAIKLVIWDLDETFWTGTLSEGAVSIADAHADLVRTLNRRGIVSAICSKNDAAAVEARLVADGLWDEFVFPRIGWIPKGETVAQLIEDMQLRPPNVLFIDDNIGNLREAEHYAPGIQTAGPEIIPHLLALPQLKGKDDGALSRLNQYRQLQAKFVDRAQSAVSNEAFLASCGVRVEIGDDCLAEQERILELINRTNQLNYTKRRLTADAFVALIAEPDRESATIRVHDRYGDYGLCGFYSLKDGELTDFVFSCRILHMGVENWLYQQLGCPRIAVEGEVATALDPAMAVTWINADGDASAPAGNAAVAGDVKVLLKGGCDLIALNDFLAGSLETELSYTNDAGAYVEWHHIEILRRSTPETLATHGEVIDRLPFLSRAEYRSDALDPARAVTHVALSLLNEYGQGLYRLRGTDFVVPYGQYYIDITDEANWPPLAKKALTPEFLRWFGERFEFLGAVDLERFRDNIRWLAGALPPGRALVLINGAEVDLGDEEAARLGLHHHQRRYNEALDEVVAALPNVSLCDVRAFVRTTDDVTFNTRHYTRQTYLAMAGALRDATAAPIRIVERGLVSRYAQKALRRLRRTLQRPGRGAASPAPRRIADQG